ncbi:MAG: outer membrane lipoprotein carrier protein LolA [Syntrophales bacterium]|jgi:outer membrane lipoprotein-sorting protein
MIGWVRTWEDIKRESEKVTSISADFTQLKHLKILSKPLVSRGHFYFQPPDSVRWEYMSPVRSVLMMSKNSIKRYTMGSKGFIEDASGSIQPMQFVLQEISRWSKGQFTANEHFSATLQTKTETKIILSPREKTLSDMISRIVITLASDRAGIIKSVKIYESEVDYTLFEFNNVQINGNISESIFRKVE